MAAFGGLGVQGGGPDAKPIHPSPRAGARCAPSACGGLGVPDGQSPSTPLREPGSLRAFGLRGPWGPGWAKPIHPSPRAGARCAPSACGGLGVPDGQSPSTPLREPGLAARLRLAGALGSRMGKAPPLSASRGSLRAFGLRGPWGPGWAKPIHPSPRAGARCAPSACGGLGVPDGQSPSTPLREPGLAARLRLAGALGSRMGKAHPPLSASRGSLRAFGLRGLGVPDGQSPSTPLREPGLAARLRLAGKKPPRPWS
jgi:hypothetical protein